MPTCKECNDTGVIETGNNDLPCECPAGDAAIFNVACEGQITGAEIKHRDSLPQMPTKLGDRTEYGHKFHWDDRLKCWHSTAGQNVVVMPPREPSQPWYIIIPDNNKVQDFTGHEAEERAFAVAEGYTRQQAVA